MGLDIIAISKARWVTGAGDEDAEPGDVGFHFSVGSGRRRDGMKSGSYVVGKGGRVFSGWDGSYSAYHEWRRQLSLLALGVEPETKRPHDDQEISGLTPHHFRLDRRAPIKR